MDRNFRITIKTHVIARLKDAGLDNTPLTRQPILEDLFRQASMSVVVRPFYIAALNHEMDWNEYAIDQM